MKNFASLINEIAITTCFVSNCKNSQSKAQVMQRYLQLWLSEVVVLILKGGYDK